MKVCIIQPEYCTDYNRTEEFFQKELEFFDACDDSMDIIVFPEYSDVPCLTKTREQFETSVRKYSPILLKKASDTAKRCNSMLFICCGDITDEGISNTTFAFDRQGNIVGKYQKQHPTWGEINNRKLVSDYSFEHSEPTVVEIEGYRFAFLTCYDFYFYENFANLARQNIDAVIGCSHQRSDTHLALENMSAFLAYNTNAYVLRSSVSMDVNSNIGGASLVAAPTGEILLNLKSRIGMETVDIDLNKKYYKPAGFGNPPSAHYEYIELGRRPWKYRPAGSAITLPDDIMPYPRVCAHRGFNTIAPENSMAAFGAAVALGADEIEFDLWPTADGEIVSIHDHNLERVSTGTGVVYEKTYAELLEYDFGVKFSDEYRGLKILKFEDILKKFACHTVMNIHIKSRTSESLPISYDEFVGKIAALIKKYDCEKYVYFMTGDDLVLEAALRVAPHITRCAGAGNDKWAIVERALKYDCKKVQFFTTFFNQQMIDKAKANGIICNYFYCDDEEKVQSYLDMGIDTILTNDYNRISQKVK